MELFKSRKFWLMLVDLTVSITAYFVTKYVSPEASKDILFLIGALQPVVITVIVSITVQNVEGIKAKSELETSQVYADERAAERQIYKEVG